jgi:hypothetical protein
MTMAVISSMFVMHNAVQQKDDEKKWGDLLPLEFRGPSKQTNVQGAREW